MSAAVNPVAMTPRESSALYGLLAEGADIILKTDSKGFVVHASPAIERLGLKLPGMLIGPHILDLVHPSCAASVRQAHEGLIEGRCDETRMEIPAVAADGGERWFEMQMRGLTDDRQRVYGTVSVMRSIEERRSYEERLFAASMTDPLTGLTNRRAFVAMLRHMVDQRIGGWLALFDIDHFRAINMRYGQAVGDEVLVVFADFLRSLLRREDIISRIGGESLGVLLPGSDEGQAQAICQRIIDTLAEIRQASGGLRITASAGLSPIARTVDHTIKRAEIALFLAKAKGRNRLEMDGS